MHTLHTGDIVGGMCIHRSSDEQVQLPHNLQTVVAVGGCDDGDVDGFVPDHL